MRAEIISVGTELLLGDILNTNAQYLAQQLAGLGYTVYYQTVVGDNAARLRQLIYDAKERSDVLVFTGGLGPTKDDLTKETVADAFGDTLVLDTDELVRLEYFFKKRGMPMTDNNRKQAMVPRQGQKLPNPNGTAPGAWFRQGGKYAVLLPGPPSEMKPMFDEYVKPLLEAMQDSTIRSVTLRVFGIGESVLEDMIAPLLEGSNPTAALYAKTGEVHIRITAKGANAEQADTMCDDTAALVRDALGDVIYSDNGDDIETTLVHLLIEEGATLATAESCTGGLLAGRLTSVPGASAVFGFGAVTYANETKHDMLGVRNATLRQFGAVSSQVAAEMAFGAQSKGEADFGIGITGIAGPDGGTVQKPVGLVYVALAAGSEVYVKRLDINDRGRDYVRQLATQHALDMARRAVLGLPLPGTKRFTKGQQADLDRAGPPKRRGTAALRIALAVLLAALVLVVVGVLASQGGQQQAPTPSAGLPSSQGLSYGTAEYTTAACRYVAEAAAENPSVVGFVALPGAAVEELVAQVGAGKQGALEEVAGNPGAKGLAVMAGGAAPGVVATHTLLLGDEDFDALLSYRNSGHARDISGFTYYTARDATEYEVVALYLFDEGEDAADDFSPTTDTLAGRTAYLDFLIGAKARSLYDIPLQVNEGDSFISLAVADPEVEGRRVYMLGRRLGPGQTAAAAAAPAGEPLMPLATYREQGQSPPDTLEVYQYWLQRLLTDHVTNSALQLAAGMPPEDTAPVVWRTGRVTPAPPASSAPASSSQAAEGSSAGSGEGASSEGGASSSSSQSGSGSTTSASTSLAAAFAGTFAADASSSGEDGSAGSSSSYDIPSVPDPVSTPPPASSYQTQMVADRPDPDYLTVRMNGVEVTDTTATVLAWICQRDAAGLSEEAVKAVAVAAHSWILNLQGAGVEAPAVVGRKPSAAMLATVRSVEDQILSADGENPAFTPSFALSAQGTNAAAAVWGSARPYLAGVSSPYEQDRTGWRQLTTLGAEEVAALVLENLGTDLSATAPESWFTDITRSDTGYVQSLAVGGTEVTGFELWWRVLAKEGAPLLPSPAFEAEYKGADSGFTFITYGAGHGVGLSLAGAQSCATREGWGYERILETFFPGAALMTWD